MKKILLIIPSGGVGGIERLAITFYNEYKRKGYKVKVVKLISLENDVVSFGTDEIALSRKDLPDFNIIERSLFYLSIPAKLRKIIKKNKITHSISFGDMSNTFNSLTYTSEFKVGSIHSLKSVELNSRSMLNLIFKLSYRTSCAYFDKMVAISKEIKSDLIDKCNYKFSNKLEVIYNPHNVENILKNSEIHLDEKEEVIFHKDVILFLGRISVQKALWHLIKSFKLFLDNNNNAELVFIGEGDTQITNWLVNYAKKNGIHTRVHFLGRKDNPYKYLARAKVLALTSYYEGTPNVIVEAIALNIPIVTTNCTKGIFEMMTINDNELNDVVLEVESGIITQNLYRGNNNYDDNILEEEIIYSTMLAKVIKNNEYYKAKIKKHRTVLLDKFDVNKVCQQYLD